MSKKKVLYVICSSHPSAGGGHFHSLLTIVKSLNPFVEYKVLNVGLVHAPTLKKNIVSDYIQVSKSTYFFKMPEIIAYIKEYNPDVLHAFDSAALSILRTANLVTNKPLVFSKCGGINGGPFIQDADAYINFSQENTNHYAKFKKNDVAVYLLPNRAVKIKSDTERIEKLRNEYSIPKEDRIILRIARFHEMHEGSIMQAIALLKLAVDSGKKYTLVVIGMVQSEAVLERVKAEGAGYPLIVVTDSFYTTNASELIDVSDIVVATGRGVMEAASLGKILFCPISESKYPAPLNADNADIMLSYNFSQRTKGISSTPEGILDYLNGDAGEIKIFIDNLFFKHFDVKAVIPSYLNIYDTVVHRKNSGSYLKNYFGDLIRYLKPAIFSKNFYTRNVNK